MAIVKAAAVPHESKLYRSLGCAQFHDAYEAPLRNALLSPADIFLRASRATPNWVGRLMALRNALVRRIGLKDVGSMREASDKAGIDYRTGDRMGIFNVLMNDPRELLLGIDDHHLDVRVSVVKGDLASSARYTISTAVYIKNWLGHLYMLPVAHIHPLVVRSMMRRADV